MLGHLFELGLDPAAVHLEHVALRPDLRHREPIARALVAQVDGAPDLGARPRAARAGRTHRSGRARWRWRRRTARSRRGPARRRRGAWSGPRPGPAGGPASRCRPRRRAARGGRAARAGTPGWSCPSSITTIVSAIARRRRAIASSRVRPWAMILAIIESNCGGTTSPSATPLSTRIAGATRQPQQRDPSGRGREPEPRVLGVQARLDRVAAGRRGLTLEPAAGGDVELELDQVDAGDHLGHGVLDLKPGVDLHE